MARDFEMFEIFERSSGCLIGRYYKNEKRIYVDAVFSTQRGFLKQSLNKLCKKYQTNEVEFTKIITPNLITVLEGFKPLLVYNKELREFQLNLVGKWKMREKI